LKETSAEAKDAHLLKLLSSGGEWKILIERVDVLEKFME